jgi:DNA modification methylase
MHTLLLGDTLQLLTNPEGLRNPEGKLLRADASITDPPYNVKLDSRGEREWDDFQTDRFAQSNKEFWKWCTTWLRPLMTEILYPGSLVAAFSGHRTVHALMFGLEDAGFDIMDVALWLYATGQVKHKQKLKPAYEPIVIGRRKNPNGESEKQLNEIFKKNGRAFLHTQELKAEEGRHPLNVIYAEPEALSLDLDLTEMGKFLYVPKPSVKDRDYGCDDLPIRKRESELSGIDTRCEACDARLKNVSPKVTKEPCTSCGKGPVVYMRGLSTASGEGRNIHPTVKPIELMRRLVRLCTKPGATVIDPFMGSGTTGVACVLEGRKFIGIEREAEYFEIAKHRIEHAEAEVAAGNQQEAA